MASLLCVPLSRAPSRAPWRAPLRRALVTASSHAPYGSDPWQPTPGFRGKEYGLGWFPSKEKLFQSNPGPVLVSASYEFQPTSHAEPKTARKFASFPSHEEYWELLQWCERKRRPHGFHELLTESSPRCLYFDVDGDVRYRGLHHEMMIWLRLYVRWFFRGDQLGWDVDDPVPVVLTSSDALKYSCHVVFPQLQFCNHATQQEYVISLLAALPALHVTLTNSEPLPILEKVVDTVPYTKFQALRGPYACKLKGGCFHPDTQLEPENLFREDAYTCFAAYVNKAYELPLPSMQRLMEMNTEIHEYMRSKPAPGYPGTGMPFREGPTPNDIMNLYKDEFKMYGHVQIDFAGLTPIEQYEEALRLIHPDRAAQYWSWMRISGVTYKMLEKHCTSEEDRIRVWKAHMTWAASTFPRFCERENENRVLGSRGKNVSGPSLLVKLVRWDNPDAQVRENAWKTPRSPWSHHRGSSELRSRR